MSHIIYNLNHQSIKLLGQATVVSSSRVGSACGKAGYWQHALETSGTRFRDAVCFNVAISACSRGGLEHLSSVSELPRGKQWLKAVSLLEEMEESRVTPDEISYNAAISACESWRMSLALLKEMKEVRSRARLVASWRPSSGWTSYPMEPSTAQGLKNRGWRGVELQHRLARCL